MKLKADRLVRTMTPRRAAEVLKTHDVVDSYTSKHEKGQQFAERIWPLLKKYTLDEDSIGKDDLMAICNQELNHLRDSALLFCEEAFHTTIEELTEESRSKGTEKAWRFREMALFLNDHPEEVDRKLLEWAGFTWDEEFVCTLEIDEAIVDSLIEEINADEIKDIRHNREYYGYGGDYLDIPDWITYLSLYLEDKAQYKRLHRVMEKLEYLPLQDALGYRIQMPKTFVEILNLSNRNVHGLGVMLLSHWYRETVREGGTLRGYVTLASDYPLAKEGQRLFELRENGIEERFKSVLDAFCDFSGRYAVERWYYGENHFSGLSESDAKDSENEVRQLIEDYLENTFTVRDAMTDFANARYLVFLAKQCERLRDEGLIDCLEKAYQTFLLSSSMYQLPAFGDDLLELYRGYTMPLQMRGTYKQQYKEILKKYLTRHEGLGWKITDDYNNKVYREAFVMSALMLMTEDEDLLESDRKQIFEETTDLLFRQIASCWMPHLQERYVEALKMGYTMVCQVWKDNREAYESRLVNSVDNLQWVAVVLSSGDGKIFDETARVLQKRWEKEHLVMYIRAQQIHQMRQYEWMKKWIEGTRG